MKKIVTLICGLFLLLTQVAFAEPSVPSGKPNVAVMYVNNGKTKYDDAVDQSVLANLAKCITADKYNYIDGKPYIEKLNKIGIQDISTAERSDIVDAMEGENIDYVVYVEIQPFVRKEKVSFFSYGVKITTQIPFKVIDVVNNKYLYNGKFVESADDSTMFGGLGNKGIALKALDHANQQMASVLTARLPETKPVKRAAK